ncbi:uncharacterized protein PG986_006559 [Apiospora aurea]|uniref:DUF7730 domain-containing protein n=1 Tax=Apiospora aurea TaxID=335848 RepID=A0ABR1QKR2_9PEZI
MSSFLALPAEIRGMIYRPFLVGDAPAQHVVASGDFWGRKYNRFPCASISDHDFLQNLSRWCGKGGWGNYLTIMRFSMWRNGHLGCEPGTLFHRAKRLPSPTPLFLTCRQIYREAAVYVYDTPLIFHTWDAFRAFLARTRGVIPAGGGIRPAGRIHDKWEFSQGERVSVSPPEAGPVLR